MPKMTDADEKAIRQGIDVAERQIAEIESRLSEIERLKARRSSLEVYIQHAKELLGESNQTELHKFTSTLRHHFNVGSSKEPRPIWADAAPILAQAQRTMTVPEIVEKMKEAGRTFGAVNVVEVVRAAITRRPDVFQNMGQGRIAIKSWPEEWKKREAN